MNKIYKVIWSKVKNCYVVASELAKSHTKSPKTGVVGNLLEHGIMLSLCHSAVCVPMITAPVAFNYAKSIQNDNDKPFKITVAAIVKNEAENVPTWVQAARSCADEIIVVDTGSIDGTVERFADYGIKCFHYDWHDDFASAKNYMISLCHGDWIVLLDGDEWFREGCDVRKAIAKHHSNPITKAIIADWICLDKDRNNAVMFSGGAVRAFRNQPDVRYFRKVHENLTIGYENFAFEPEFKMYHTGYSGSVNRSKHERNLRIMRTMFDFDNGKVEYPTDWRYIEDTYAGLGDYPKALWAADKMISFGIQEYSAAAWITKFNVLFVMKTPLAEMKKQFEYCFRTVPSVSGFRFLASIYYFRTGQIEAGLDNYIEGLRMLMGPQDKVAVEHTYWRMYMPEASALASAVYLQNKQVEASLYACKVCEQYCGQTDWTNRALADVRRVMNQTEEGLLGNISERVLPVLQFGKKAVLATALASSLTIGMVNPVFAGCTIGGSANCSNGTGTVAVGGKYNEVYAPYSVINGGCCNIINGYASVINGGQCNYTGSCFYSYIDSSGCFHYVYPTCSAIVTDGGIKTITLSNGDTYTLTQYYGQYTSIVGGSRNLAMGDCSTIVGGWDNITLGLMSTVSGATSSCAYGNYSSVFGGCSNVAFGEYSSAVGGSWNHSCGCYSLAAGSCWGYAYADYSTAIGGSITGIENPDYDESVTGSPRYLGTGSVAIGKCATTTRDYEVAIGSACAPVKIGGNLTVTGTQTVTDGTTTKTWSQLLNASGGGSPCFADGVVLGGNNFSTSIGCYSVVAGGRSNYALCNLSTVIGGSENNAEAEFATIVGGCSNFAKGVASSVYGASSSSACADYSNIFGGVFATAMGMGSTILGGVNGRTYAMNSVSLGGGVTGVSSCSITARESVAIGKNATTTRDYEIAIGSACAPVKIDGALTVDGAKTVTDGTTTKSWTELLSGGSPCFADGVVLAGCANTASGCYSSISGGECNYTTGYGSSVSGGYCNTACFSYSSVSGGCCNIARGGFSSVSGGCGNTASGVASSVSGGQCNIASGFCASSVSGGYCNTASGNYSSVSGGYLNTASEYGSSVSGGKANEARGIYSSVSGGWSNTACGHYSSVVGGSDGTAYACYSTVIGGGITGNASCNETALGSVAIGKGSTTTRDYEVAIGSSDAPVKIGGNLTVTGTQTVTDGTDTKTWTDIIKGYTLPAATSSALGGVKIGSNITNTDGTISLTKANVTAALGYTPPTEDTNTTYDNMSATELSTGTATTARSISAKIVSDYVTGKVSAETTARTTAINSEATTRANADTALGTRIDNAISAYESADTSLSNRIGTLSADGNYIKKSATNNVSANLIALDTQLKTTTTAVSTETTNRTNADTALSNRIGSVASDGTFIKKSATNDVATNLIALDTAAKNAIKGLSVSGTTITYTKSDGTTGTITTQDNNTTYANMTASELETGTATAARSISAKVLADYVNSRVGDSTVSTGSTGSTAVGDSSVVTGNNSVSVGDNSSVTGTGSVSVGTGSSVEGDSNVSIGNNGSVSGSNSVAIGSDTETTESNAVAVGGGSSATGEGAVSLGAGTSAKGDNSTALGNNSYSANDNSVALGSNAVASASDVVSVGHKAGDTDAEGNVYTTNEYRRIINVANGVNANDAATVGQMNTAINTETSARTAADTALGARIDGTIKGLSVNGRTITYTKGDGTTGTITTQDTTYSAGSGLTLSNGAFSVNTNGAVVSGNTGIVTGGTVYDALEARLGQSNVTAGTQDAVTVGDNTTVTGDGAVAVGTCSTVNGESSVAVGDTSTATGDNSVAIGGNTTAEGNNTIAVGGNSNASHGGAVAVGGNSEASAQNAVAVGTGSSASTVDSTAVGGGSSATGNHSTALGGNTVVNNDNSVALGYDSNASQDNVLSVGHKATDLDVNGNAYGTDLTRRIVNVANGTTATDVATVGQTYILQNSTNTTVADVGTNAIGQHIYQMTVNTDGQVASGNTGIVTGGTVYEALESRIGQITVGNDAQNTVALGDNSSVSGDGAVAVGSGSSGSGEGSVAIGDTSSSSGEGSVAVGTNTTAQSDNTVAIGTGSTITGTNSNNSVAIGQQTSVTGSNSVALGGGSSVTGSDSVALGGGSSVTGSAATAVGKNTVVTNDNSVAIGSGSNASQDNVVSVGHSATDLDSSGTAYGSDLNRRIVNVADAVNAHDAVTKGQMDALMADHVGTLATNGNYILKDNTTSANMTLLDTQLKSAVDSIGTLSNNAVAYSSETKDVVVYSGTNGTVLRNVKGGAVTQTSMEAVNGSQLYAVKQDITGFASDIQANATNIDNLNSSVTAALSSVSASGLLVDSLDNSKADKSLSNLSDAGKRVLKSYAEDAVATYLAEQGLAVPAAPMAINTTNSNTLSVTNAGNGSLHVGEGSYVNGTSSIAIGVGNQVNANNSGAFGDPSIINADESYVLGNDDTINTGATGSFIVGNDGVSDAKGGLLFGSNTKATVDAEDGMALGNRTEVSAKNAIALGSGSIADTENTLSIGNTNLKRKIVNVADGLIAEDSHEAITGAQLFVTNEKVQKNTEAIEKKADADASNINVEDWTSKLGVGKVESGDSGLVTGGTVYNAIKDIGSNDLVKSSGDVITIGANNNASIIDVTNSEGSGRVITGVITDTNDATSVANVGYVNAVGENILNATNKAFQKVDTKVNKVGANAAAIANLPTPTFDGEEKWAFAAGVGHYQGETAGAVGAFYKPTDNVIARVSGSFGNGDEMIGAGVAVSLNKGNTPTVSKAQLVRTINAQAGQIQAQNERIQMVEQENTNMKMKYESEIAELKAMVADLAAKVK